MAAAVPLSSPTEDPAPAQAGAVLAGGSCVPKARGHLGLPRNRLLGRIKALQLQLPHSLIGSHQLSWLGFFPS